jgi:hypothetical protein
VEMQGIFSTAFAKRICSRGRAYFTRYSSKATSTHTHTKMRFANAVLKTSAKTPVLRTRQRKPIAKRDCVAGLAINLVRVYWTELHQYFIAIAGSKHIY